GWIGLDYSWGDDTSPSHQRIQRSIAFLADLAPTRHPVHDLPATHRRRNLRGVEVLPVHPDWGFPVAGLPHQQLVRRHRLAQFAERSPHPEREVTQKAEVRFLR